MLEVYVTCKNVAEANRIGERVVRERLAACANIVPKITSFYWWEGKMTKDSESLLFLKTADDKFEPLRKRILQLHSYTLPCIVAYKIARAHKPYEQWVRKETRG